MLPAMVFWTAIAGAQQPYSRWSLHAAVGNQAVGFPFENLFSSSHPALSVGVDFRLNKSLRHSLSLSSGAGVFSNSLIGNTMMSGLDLHYRYTTRSGVFGELQAGVGALAQFHPRKTWTLNAETGAYTESKEGPFWASEIGFGVGLGYDFSRRFGKPYAVFLKNRFFFESPYFKLKAFPIMPQNILELGVSFKLKRLEHS